MKHDSELSSFQYQIDTITKHGFNLIAISEMYMEDTFVFETHEEATKAYEAIELKGEKGHKVIGWWYGKDEFQKTVELYEKEFKLKVKVIWL